MRTLPNTAATRVAEWLLEAALGQTTAPDAFLHMIRMLRQEGVQIDRGHLTYTTLHPLNHGSGATWTAETGLVTEDYSYDRDQFASGWHESPIRHLIAEHAPRLRRRLHGPGATLDFPILRKLAAEGMTDYLLQAHPFDSFNAQIDIGEDEGRDSCGMAVSFCTKRAGGFSDEEIDALTWLVAPLAMVVKMADQRQIAINLAECYIGREAGPRVLGGAIRRGDFSSTKAVVWLSDLRQSTEMSMRFSREEYIETINGFFDCTVGAVEAEGGEPLTFIGDAALAIFPIDQLGEVGARAAAWTAAQKAEADLNALNADRAKEGREALSWGIALHAGRLDYGNIGSPTRHAWSVIGPVVNETARLESVTKEVGRTILASRAFVADWGADWRRIGAFDLKGVPEGFEAFAPPELDVDGLEEAS